MTNPIAKMKRMKEARFNALPKSIQEVILANRRMYAEWWLAYVEKNGKFPPEYGTAKVRSDE